MVPQEITIREFAVSAKEYARSFSCDDHFVETAMLAAWENGALQSFRVDGNGDGSYSVYPTNFQADLDNFLLSLGLFPAFDLHKRGQEYRGTQRLEHFELINRQTHCIAADITVKYPREEAQKHTRPQRAFDPTLPASYNLQTRVRA
jgi:hypothetical protein